jgi:hypothetical protein
MSVIKRHSLLKRHPSLSRADFARHYREVHGPLAAAQAGFRKFAYRYDQNHVEGRLPGDGEAPFDGVTVSFQTPRANYRQGFFQHPDYANVRPDEEHLFDLAATVSVLGAERVLLQGSTAGGAKAILLSPADGGHRSDDGLIDAARSHGVRTLVRNDLDVDSPSALGAISSVGFPHARLWEIWFATPAARQMACGNAAFVAALYDGAAVPIILAVHQIVIFAGPPPSSEARDD